MLQELHIRNFALIERVDLHFGQALNLLTGETGAGKSIVIDALGIALGERASSDIIRTGQERAIVEAVFDLADAPDETRRKLAEAGIDDEDGDGLLYVAREITRAGKSLCRINGRLCPVATLREICDLLVDIHGQHEHQSLLVADKHIDILDGWLGQPALEPRDAIANGYEELLRLRRELEDLRKDARERARNLDLYRYQQTEIAEADLKPGEEEEFEAEKLRLANAEKLASASGHAYDVLADSVVDGLSVAAAEIERAAVIDPTLAPVAEQLGEAIGYADEARSLLRRYRENVEFNPDRLEEIEERLNLFHTLKRKYGDTIDDVIAYGESLQAKLFGLEDQEGREAELTSAIAKRENSLAQIASRLSETRRDAGTRYANAIVAELSDLGMAATRFEVSIAANPLSRTGTDRIEFLLSPNPGEPMRPLAKIASGGETSRIMLAIKSVLSRAIQVPTLIFDEIDVGVGGRTAKVIGEKLVALANTAQVLCITHLPQIASMPASAHFSIEKQSSGDTTLVTVHNLDEEQRVGEITRMLGGMPEQQTVVEHARQMLRRA
ncbi:MAG: DNA repair protein RecN [Capsulimonadaceae bacterium]|nr:DNA repair protein RecN [Capsulimonadaceae bacterium]